MLAKRLCQNQHPLEGVTFQPNTPNSTIAVRGCPRSQLCGAVVSAFTKSAERRCSHISQSRTCRIQLNMSWGQNARATVIAGALTGTTRYRKLQLHHDQRRWERKRGRATVLTAFSPALCHQPRHQPHDHKCNGPRSPFANSAGRAGVRAGSTLLISRPRHGQQQVQPCCTPKRQLEVLHREHDSFPLSILLFLNLDVRYTVCTRHVSLRLDRPGPAKSCKRKMGHRFFVDRWKNFARLGK